MWEIRTDSLHAGRGERRQQLSSKWTRLGRSE